MVDKMSQASEGLLNVKYTNNKEKPADLSNTEKSTLDTMPSAAASDKAASVAEGGLIDRLSGNRASSLDTSAAQEVLKLVIDQMKQSPIVELFNFSDESRSHLFQLLS